MITTKKLPRHALAFGSGIVATSVMSDLVGSNNAVAQKGQEGLQKFAGYFPATGGLIGAGLTLGALMEMQKAAEKFRRRRM